VQPQGWVALLRAVNVGGHNRVPMAELRKLLSELGFGSIATFIASGNVLFTAETSRREAIADRLEDAIAESFGVETTAVLRTPDELRRLFSRHPFGNNGSTSFVSFLAAKPTPAAVRALAALDFAPDEAKVAGSDVYLRYPNGFSGAKLTNAALERALGVPGTARNWRTVTKLAELAKELG